MSILRAAIEMVEANAAVEYAEIKFVKLIRSELALSDEEILLVHPNFEEYLKQDIVSSVYKDRLISQFFIDENFPVLMVPDLGDGEGTS
ncbi:MAG: hypothetical protein IPK70_17225 [Flavobacteriales bacterium]|nr:hypothetical protein [Flavobacteriales bacterium]